MDEMTLRLRRVVLEALATDPIPRLQGFAPGFPGGDPEQAARSCTNPSCSCRILLALSRLFATAADYSLALDVLDMIEAPLVSVIETAMRESVEGLRRAVDDRPLARGAALRRLRALGAHDRYGEVFRAVETVFQLAAVPGETAVANRVLRWSVN